jgi:hypothetical protein
VVSQITNKARLERVIFFFPFQLLALHFKKNHLLLLFWFFLFGYITENIGTKYGIHILFLFPEYLDKVNFWSFFMVGLSIGGFIMAFNLYSYIMHGFRFPFIATISKPFFKFSVNNFIIPVLFVILYCIYSYDFQLNRELLPVKEIMVNLVGFIAGVVSFIILCFSYFMKTNRDAEFYKLQRELKQKQKKKLEGWFSQRLAARSWRVDTYLRHPFNIRLARVSDHYDQDVLAKVLTQNHVNAALFEIIAILTFIILGTFSSYKFFIVPAGASMVLVFTMYLMLVSALFNWFKGWTMTILFVSFFALNVGHHYFKFLGADNRAYGLDYSTLTEYKPESVENLRTQKEISQQDYDLGITILENWKNNVTVKSEGNTKKPKLILIGTSGGGLRATLWTYYALQLADSLCNDKLLKHTKLISGSSGGMIGAAMVRELYLRKKLGTLDAYHQDFGESLGGDILNPVVFSMATNDLFIRYRTFKYGNFNYIKDRGYAFEKELNENTQFFLDKKLSEYAEPEFQAIIPQFVLSPTIVNDGRRLLISSTPISYLVNNRPTNPFIYNNPITENIEFSRYFAKQGAHNLRFLTALRMNATFPFILPTVSLPTDPPIEIMDAGLRDNFGMLNNVKYLFTFKDWIEENTSGVIILQIRDKQKNRKLEHNAVPSMLEKMASPVQALYTNFERVQNFEHDKLMEYTSSWFKGKIDVIDLELTQSTNQNISLSWHLTALEKKQIKNAIYLPKNKDALLHLKQLLH